jgi:molybdopterin/thiamine biosynthesis adenylyltransferase
MAAKRLITPCTVRFPPDLWERLQKHLFPGDHDEHGAVIGAGIVQTKRGTRLLARTLYLAEDGVDYVPGDYGYRKLTAEFVRDRILDCREDGLAYLAIHCHGGQDEVAFSRQDLASHERGYPALSDIAAGQVVGALVFASNAVAGDLWLPNGDRINLTGATIVQHPLRKLYPAPLARPVSDLQYDRQARLFGDRGQHCLANQKVGVIGAGGAGSLIVEYLARLGVGHLVVIDPERLDVTNLPRVVGSLRSDALAWLQGGKAPSFVRKLAERLSRLKVSIAARVAKQANPGIAFEAIAKNVVDPGVALRLVDCDYVFLAADSMQARLVFNALVHQYCIPGVQVGAKVPVDRETGDVSGVFSVVRPVWPGHGCLWCNELISPAGLQAEALSEQERERQRYVDEPTVNAPSVITLNAVAAAHAVNDYLFNVTGLLYRTHAHQYTRFIPQTMEVVFEQPRKDAACRECGSGQRGRLSYGDSRRLPTK